MPFRNVVKWLINLFNIFGINSIFGHKPNDKPLHFPKLQAKVRFHLSARKLLNLVTLAKATGSDEVYRRIRLCRTKLRKSCENFLSVSFVFFNRFNFFFEGFEKIVEILSDNQYRNGKEFELRKDFRIRQSGFANLASLNIRYRNFLFRPNAQGMRRKRQKPSRLISALSATVLKRLKTQ